VEEQMDAATTQLLAQRIGLSQEDTQALLSGEITVPMVNRAAATTADPLTAVLLTSMLKQRSQSSADNAADPPAETALSRAQETIRELKQHLSDADAMIAHLADTFGACPVCWGSSDLCRRCRGTGKPGSSVPAEEEFLSWVGLPLERLGFELVKKQAMAYEPRGRAGGLDRPADKE
jgi:hypothetical protein